jgi:hypothetical protein
MKSKYQSACDISLTPRKLKAHPCRSWSDAVAHLSRSQATPGHFDQTVLYALSTKLFNRNQPIGPRDPDRAGALQPLWRPGTGRISGGTPQKHEVTISGLPQHRRNERQ